MLLKKKSQGGLFYNIKLLSQNIAINSFSIKHEHAHEVVVKNGGFHFKYYIDKSIGLDNRLCLYKSSPTTRWNHLNTIYILILRN